MTNYHNNAGSSYQRVIQAAENLGLNVRETESGKRAAIQTPGHSAKDDGTKITYTGEQTLIFCHNGDTDDVLDALGLRYAALYDNPRGVTYKYDDGFTTHRTPDRVFWQLCVHGIKKKDCKQGCKDKIRALYNLSSLKHDGPVYVVEGEKDADTATRLLNVAAVSPAQGAGTKPEKSDWSRLAGRDVIIVADKDEVGYKHADAVQAYLQKIQELPASIQIVEALEGKDLSDHVAAGHGVDALVQLSELVRRRHVKLVPASSVKTERVEWLIENWIPAGMLTLLAGREGIGKSTIACGWVAEFSKQGMKCAYLNSEDSRGFTVKPRLEAAGANLDNVSFIDVETETGSEGHLTLPRDTRILFDALETNGVKFVVLDAAKSSMDPKLDGYKDDHVRQFLEPIASEADRRGITIVGLAHFGKAEGKDTGRLLLGSIAWSQIARSVLSAAVDDEGRLIVTNTKANLAPAIVSRQARIVARPVHLDDGELTEVGAIEWGDFTDTSATELLDRRSEEGNDERDEVEAVVIDYLESQGGSAKAGEVLKVTRAAGLSDNSVKKARKKIGVETRKAGMGGGWVWSITAGAGFEDAPKVPEGAEDSRTRERAPSAPSEAPSATPPNISPITSKKQPDDNDLETAIIHTLHTEFGLSAKTVKGSLTTTQIKEAGDIDTYLNAMCERGAITTDSKGLYFKLRESA